MNSTNSLLLSLLLSLFLVSPANAETIPDYQPLKLEKGAITSVGSDSMGGIMQEWVDAYKQKQTGVEVNVISRGSATAPVALIDGSADIGPMSRTMKKDELREFTTRYGFEPTQIKTAIAGVAVFVSDTNPLEEISLEELDAIYSKDRKREVEKISAWSALGVEGELANKQIEVFGRIDDSIPSYSFKQRALIQGAYLEEVMQIASGESLIEAVRLNKNSIGFGEYINPLPKGVKVLSVKESKDSKAYAPTTVAMSSTEYPLSRYLNFYFVKEPNKEVDTATKDFLNFVLSKEGQQIVKSSGLLPLTQSVLKEERSKY